MNFNDKYKERKPLETVKIIKNFFKKRQLIINEVFIKETEIGTWSSALELKLDDNTILTSCGKGISKDFCNASAHAELYERFCNMEGVIKNKFLFEAIKKNNLKENGFNIDKSEKLLCFEDAINEIDHNKFFKKIQKFISKNTLNNIYEDLCDNKFIGLKYQNITNKNDYKYIDLLLFKTLNETTGLAAGNTLEEALVQGISEMLERHVNTKVFKKQKFKKNKYYYIDNKSIKNEKIKSIIDNIKNSGNDVYIYDLSYTFNLPVIATLLINKVQGRFDVNFGCHPIFDIALERTLTEIYQGINYTETTGFFYTKAFKGKNLVDYYMSSISCNKEYIPDDFIFNCKKTKNFNNNVFLKCENNSNIQLLNYYKKLLIKNDIKIYYRDSSLTKDMYAISLYSPNVLNPLYSALMELDLNQYTDKSYLVAKQFYNAFHSLLMNNDIQSAEKYFKIYLKNSDHNSDVSFMNVFGYLPLLAPIKQDESFYNDFIQELRNPFSLNDLNKILKKTFYNKHFKLYGTILNYLNKGFSKEDTLKLFKHFNPDINFLSERNYLKYSIFKPYLDFYTSNNYKILINSYTCKKGDK